MACGLLLSDCRIYIQPINDPIVPHGLELRTSLWLMDHPAEAFVDVWDQPKRQRQPRFSAGIGPAPHCSDALPGRDRFAVRGERQLQDSSI